MINTERKTGFAMLLFAALLMAATALTPRIASAHCPDVTVNLHGIDCRIYICVITPNGRYCDTVVNGTTIIPVVGGLSVSGVVIDTGNGPVSIAQGACVDNIRVAPGCCVKVCVTTDMVTGCTIVNITPATNPC